jgi:hypothetical protein
VRITDGCLLLAVTTHSCPSMARWLDFLHLLPVIQRSGGVVRRLTDDGTNWHIRVRKALEVGTSGVRSSTHGEKKPCPEARKTGQMITAACRNLLANFLSSGLSTKSKDTHKSPPNTFFVLLTVPVQRPRRPGQRDTRNGWKHVFSPENWLQFHKAVRYM